MIPISDSLAAWLELLERQGKVVPRVKAHHWAVSALAVSLKIRWPRNMLRYPFINYRISIVQSADQEALESGKLPSIIFKHDREMTTEEQVVRWFSIMP